MRINRTRDEWRTLFQQQERSGLSKTQFCRQHGITRSAFSNARYRLSADRAPTSAFIPVLPPTQCIEKPSLTNNSGGNEPTLKGGVATNSPAAALLYLQLPGATLSLPTDISPHWLATLLREMTP
jgi:hypothetical protein